MTWEIVLGLIALVGVCITIGTVLAKLVHTLTRLDVTLGALIEEDRENNIKCKNDRRDIHRQLDEHEIRIHDLERA